MTEEQKLKFMRLTHQSPDHPHINVSAIVERNRQQGQMGEFFSPEPPEEFSDEVLLGFSRAADKWLKIKEKPMTTQEQAVINCGFTQSPHNDRLFQDDQGHTISPEDDWLNNGYLVSLGFAVYVKLAVDRKSAIVFTPENTSLNEKQLEMLPIAKTIANEYNNLVEQMKTQQIESQP